MYPVLYNILNQKVAVLDNIYNTSIKRSVNGEFLFSFEAVESLMKSEYFTPVNRIVVDNQSFDIKYIEQTHSSQGVIYKIECEHVNYRLIDGIINTVASYSYTGTPTAILNNILLGTDFISGIVDVATSLTLISNERVTKKDLIYKLAESIGCEVDYSDNGFTINLRTTIGLDNGFQVRFGKNLLGVSKIIDNRGILKTSYTVELVELKLSTDYQNKGFESLEVIEVGDTIKIIDEVISLNVQNRVVSIEYDPMKRINTSLVIANEIPTISSTIQTIANEKLTKEGLYNGIQIGPNEGFVALRSDNKAKVLMNATEGISIYSDTGSGLQKNFYVDLLGRIQATGLTIDGTSEFKGKVDVTNGLSNVKIAPNDSYPFRINYNTRDIFRVDTLGNADLTQISLRNDMSGASYLSITPNGMYSWNAALALKTFDLNLTGDLTLNQINLVNKFGGTNSGIRMDSNSLYAWNASIGEKTFEIDVSGNAFFRGNVTSLATITGAAITGSLITGATIKTNASGRRIELTGTSMKGYDSSNNRVGLYFDIGSNNIADVKLYQSGGSEGLVFYDDYNRYVIKPGSGSSNMAIGEETKNMIALGNWSFNSAIISGIAIDTNSAHTHTVVVNGTTYTTSSIAGHTHTIY